MTTLMRFISTCLLVLLLATVALADGGETHGTGLASLPPPPTECVVPCISTEPSYSVQEDPSLNAAELANVLVSWLSESIL
jgi:hypothetical protein